MRRDHGVEEWLPGGLAVREPVTDAADVAEFTLNGAPDGSPQASHAEANRASVDLNAVDFEGLIGLGISVGQAARFISQRELRGGIAAVADVESFHGLAPGVRDILRWSGRV